jgi:hypothetical protein
MPRNRFCTGCGETFSKTHHLRNHRHSERCGGEYLPKEIRLIYNNNRLSREYDLRWERYNLAYNELLKSNRYDDARRFRSKIYA